MGTGSAAQDGVASEEALPPRGAVPFFRKAKRGVMSDDQQSRRPLQFSLRSLLMAMVVTALLFGTLRWLGVSPFASGVVLVILIVGVAMAVALLVAIAGSADGDE